jgi:tRNA (adenine37-N6)-methyltransferase
MFTLQAIGFVRSDRTEAIDDHWDQVTARIELNAEFSPEALSGLAEFSHAEVIFCFDRVHEEAIERGSRHPRGNQSWPRVGIFAQRAKDRPNRLGLTTVEIVSVNERTLVVRGLDAIDGTPVLDIKPVMQEFLPRAKVRQPDWSRELMRDYW